MPWRRLTILDTRKYFEWTRVVLNSIARIIERHNAISKNIQNTRSVLIYNRVDKKQIIYDKIDDYQNIIIFLKWIISIIYFMMIKEKKKILILDL